jgi:hypothetical protein
MSYEAERKATTASGTAVMRDDPRCYRIVPTGSGPTGWATERDGKIHMTGPCVEVRTPGSTPSSPAHLSDDADDIAAADF